MLAHPDILTHASRAGLLPSMLPINMGPQATQEGMRPPHPPPPAQRRPWVLT